jgi:hypothetical protein
VDKTVFAAEGLVRKEAYRRGASFSFSFLLSLFFLGEEKGVGEERRDERSFILKID